MPVFPGDLGEVDFRDAEVDSAEEADDVEETECVDNLEDCCLLESVSFLGFLDNSRCIKPPFRVCGDDSLDSGTGVETAITKEDTADVGDR